MKPGSPIKIRSVVELFDMLPENERILVDVLRQIIIENLPSACKEKISYNVPFFYGKKGICIIWLDGTTGATNATNLVRSYTLGTPIIVGAGKVVSYSIGGVPAILCGFEVAASVTPVSAFINTGGTGTYTVPAGKTLYILSFYDQIASSISIDPATGTFLTVFNSHANSTTTGAGTFAQFNQLLQPIIVPANGLVKSSDALTTRVSFNGYLK